MRYHTCIDRRRLEMLIQSPEGYRVGWELHREMNGVMWSWAKLVYDRSGKVARCEFVRHATKEEAAELSHLLKGDIACRYQGVLSGNAWAFACLD